MDRVGFDRIIRDVKSSFLMENLKISDKVISNMREMYFDNNNLSRKSFIVKRRRMVRYEVKRK